MSASSSAGGPSYVRLLGVHHAALDAGETGEPLAFAVHRLEIEYRRPARIDDVVEVVTRPKEIRGARIILSQQVRRAGELLVDASVTVVLVNRAGRPCRIPDTLAERFAAAPEQGLLNHVSAIRRRVQALSKSAGKPSFGQIWGRDSDGRITSAHRLHREHNQAGISAGAGPDLAHARAAREGQPQEVRSE